MGAPLNVSILNGSDWLLNCCWPSPAQLFLVPSSAGLTSIFHCLTALGAFRLLTWLSLWHAALYQQVEDQLENTALSSSSTVVRISIAPETCFKKPLHSSGYLYNASLTQKFWPLCVVSQYVQIVELLVGQAMKNSKFGTVVEWLACMFHVQEVLGFGFQLG
jgi:hypothetical protein